MKAYNGIIELTVGPLSNKSEIALVKQKASEQPQTRCAFMGSDVYKRQGKECFCVILLKRAQQQTLRFDIRG